MIPISSERSKEKIGRLDGRKAIHLMSGTEVQALWAWNPDRPGGRRSRRSPKNDHPFHSRMLPSSKESMMSMFRKLMLGTVMSLSLMAPSSLLARGEAHRDHAGRHRHDAFYVYYRAHAHMPWLHAGAYRNRADADRAAQYYREAGYEAFMYRRH
jgi:hypothetical protein